MVSLRKDDGFIELDSLKYKKENESYIFMINDKKYYFKKARSINKVYNELISEEIAKDYKIDNAKYDLASLYGFVGSISEDFIDSNKFIFIRDLIDSHIKDRGLSKYNNLNDLKELLKNEYNNEDLFNKLLDIFVFDILIGNSDRHIENYGLYINDKPRFAPLFDNEYMLSTSSVYTGIYSIGLTREDYRPLLDLYTKEDDYIKKAYGKYDIYERILDKIDMIDSANMKKVLDRVEDRIDSKIIDPIKEEITSKMEDNYKNIKRKIKEYSIRT